MYNVEKYIGSCIDSILSQRTHYKYLVTIVNDGSTDNSRQILEKYRDDLRIEVIDQTNEGQASARNRALKTIRGQYLMFVDADDKLHEGAIDALLDAANRTDADIVEGSYRFFNDKNKTLFVSSNINSDDNRHLFGFPWRKVYKAQLFHDTCYPKGYWFEDTCGWMMLLPKTKKFATISNIVYEYRKQPNATTRKAKGNVKSIDSLYVTLRLLEDRKILNYPFDQEFYDMMLHQIGTNCRRIADIGDNRINSAVFDAQVAMMKKYFKNFDDMRTSNLTYRKLDDAIHRGDYKKYLLSCLLFN